ncbi:MAG: hypothetical protein NXI14_08340 [bacterium]|nr:hypothetical protein [bacterium]
MTSTQNWLPGAVAALGILLVTTTLLRRWVKKSRAARNHDPREKLREQRETLQNRAERDSLEHLMVEVQELTRICAAQIENRATKLEHLIELADRRLADLEQATSRRSDPLPSSAERDRTIEARPAAMPSNRSRDWSAESDEPSESPAQRRDQLAERVHELSAMGLKSVEIARQLDEQVGKVELILALRSAS